MLTMLMSVALSQSAVQPTVVPQVPVDVVGPQQPRRICRIERDTGSRVQARRICQTVNEREAERDESQRTAAEAVNRQWDRQMGDRPFNEFAMPNGQTFRQNELNNNGISNYTNHVPR